jgi:serine/threonine protein kinase
LRVSRGPDGFGFPAPGLREAAVLRALGPHAAIVGFHGVAVDYCLYSSGRAPLAAQEQRQSGSDYGDFGGNYDGRYGGELEWSDDGFASGSYPSAPGAGTIGTDGGHNGDDDDEEDDVYSLCRFRKRPCPGFNSRPGSVFLLLEFVAYDVGAILRARAAPLPPAVAKAILQQLLRALAHAHARGFVHRDVKPGNILIAKDGAVKLADWGAARALTHPAEPPCAPDADAGVEHGAGTHAGGGSSPSGRRHPHALYTPQSVTLWYRPPELLFGATVHTAAVDVWSAGCVLAELLTGRPLWRGHGELAQINLICRLLGPPTEEAWPGFGALPGAGVLALSPAAFPCAGPAAVRALFPRPAPVPVRVEPGGGGGAETTSSAEAGAGGDGRGSLSDTGFDLLLRMLTLDPARRITAADALAHAYFAEEPLPADAADVAAAARAALGEAGDGGWRARARTVGGTSDEDVYEDVQEDSGCEGLLGCASGGAFSDYEDDG